MTNQWNIGSTTVASSKDFAREYHTRWNGEGSTANVIYNAFNAGALNAASENRIDNLERNLYELTTEVKRLQILESDHHNYILGELKMNTDSFVGLASLLHRLLGELKESNERGAPLNIQTYDVALTELFGDLYTDGKEKA